MPPRGATSLIPECYYGVQAGGFVGGPDAKEQAYPYRHHDPRHGRQERHAGRNRRKYQTADERENPAEDDAGDSSQARQRRRFDEELNQHLGAPPGRGFWE